MPDKKICFKCLVSKPLHDFYKHTRMKDGHQNACKQCMRRDNAVYREKHLEKVRECGRSSSRRKAAAIRWANGQREQIDPLKRAARNAINNAIRSGRVTRAAVCESCGIGVRIHAHHKDYARQLDVDWLCSICHAEEHRRLKNAI